MWLRRFVYLAPRAQNASQAPCAGSRSPNSRLAAFTLLELLVVIAIIGIVAAIALPNLKGLTTSNVMAAANRQLLDDLGLARQLALNGRRTVYVLFLPPVPNQPPAKLAPEARDQMILGQYTSYALYADRNVGDQPGRSFPKYLSSWKSLPDGVFIAPFKFGAAPAYGIEPFSYGDFPYPTAGSRGASGGSVVTNRLAYVAFDYQGQLVSGRDAVIPLAKGSILPQKTGSGLAWAQADPLETPPGNSTNNFDHVVVDWLTGRAQVQRPEIQ